MNKLYDLEQREPKGETLRHSVTPCHSTPFSFNSQLPIGYDQKTDRSTPRRSSLRGLRSSIPYVCLDSIKIRAPRSAISSFSSGGWDTHEKAKTNTISYKLPKESRPIGINSVLVTPSELVLSLSSKVLEDQYMEHINHFTVSTALSKLNRLPGIEFDVPTLIETAKVLSADVVVDVYVYGDPLDYIATLNQSITNPNFTKIAYPVGWTRNFATLLFTRHGTKKKTSLSVYAKQIELEKSKNKALHGFISLPNLWPVLRFERRITTLADIRKCFAVDDRRRLIDILDSRRNPVAELFGEVVPKMEVSSDPVGETLNETIKRLGTEKLAEMHNWDERLIKTMVYSRMKNNPAAKFKEIMSVIQRNKESQLADSAGSPLLDELSDSLDFSSHRLW